jgi:ketosteroid isomerase-like protein
MDEPAPWDVLLQAYAEHFDARNGAAFGALFSEDATVVTPFGKDLVGRERIEGMAARTPPGGSHEIAEAAVVEQTADRVVTRTTYAAVMSDGTDVTGTYDDTFGLTADGWRIERHVISIDGSPGH